MNTAIDEIQVGDYVVPIDDSWPACRVTSIERDEARGSGADVVFLEDECDEDRRACLRKFLRKAAVPAAARIVRHADATREQFERQYERKVHQAATLAREIAQLEMILKMFRQHPEITTGAEAMACYLAQRAVN